MILINKKKVDVATIFTTHATILGRHLCSGEMDFYNQIGNIDVDFEAGSRGLYERHCIERAAAHCADVFTTVSNITAFEAEHLLKRRPGNLQVFFHRRHSSQWSQYHQIQARVSPLFIA